MNNNFWKNAYNQLHNWVSTVGLAIALAVGEYLLDNQTWTWKSAAIAAIGAFVKYFATRDDHTRTREAVQKAAVTGETPTPVVKVDTLKRGDE